jgi:putative polyketide hydroxylase
MYNAMWKVALCVHEVGGWSLVDTYDAERRDCLQPGRGRQEHRRDPPGVPPYGNHLGVEFETMYRPAAVIDDGTMSSDVNDSYFNYALCGTPGCRAPMCGWAPILTGLVAGSVRRRLHRAHRSGR